MKRNKRIDLVVASRNKKKSAEIKQILKGLKVKITSLCDYPDAPYIAENGRTFKEKAT